MLLHIRPRLFSPFKSVALVDLEIDPLGLRLVGGVDLITGRPYPNKRYAVACRKQGHNKAFNGILIETEKPVDELHCIARWAVEASTVVTHHVHYTLLDHDFDAASDDMTLWYAFCAELGGWSKRWPDWAKELAPLHAEPMMEVIDSQTARNATEDTIDGQGWIIERRQTFPMPTIERERLLDPKIGNRIPPLAMAFRPASLPLTPRKAEKRSHSRICEPLPLTDDDVAF